VRDAIKIMVRGRPDDEAAKPVDFVEAAKLADVNAWVVRQWLDRVEGRAFLKAERRAFRDAVCAGNELALKRVRDTSENGMAIIGSVRALEQIDEDEARQQRGPVQSPGLIVSIVNVMPSPGPILNLTPAPSAIDHQPEPIEAPAAELDAEYEDRRAAAPVERPAYDHRVDRGPAERETREDALRRFTRR
jgi:hypothetical protein